MADIKIASDSGKLYAGADDDLEVYNTGSHSYIKNTVNDQTIVLSTTTGGSTTAALTIAGDNNSTFTNTLKIDAGKGAPSDLGDFSEYHLILRDSGGSTNDAVGMLFTSSADTYGGSAIVHYDTGSGGTGDLAFYTKQSTSAVAPAEVMRLTDDAKVGIGTTSPDAKLEITDGLGQVSTGLILHNQRHGNNNNYLRFQKARTSDSTNETIVSSGDYLGQIDFQGCDANNAYHTGLSIYAITEGTVQSDQMPTGLHIYTCNTSGTTAEKMRLSADGLLTIGTSGFGSAGTTLKQLGLAWSTSTYWDTTSTGTFTGMAISNPHGDAGTGAGIQFSHGPDSSGISYIVSRAERANSSGGDRASLHFGTRGSDGVARRMIIGDDGVVTTSGDIKPGADVIMADGRGISFALDGNESGMTSELLDDYEEGTWSPQVWNNYSGGTQLGAGTAVGRYVKIGQLVHIQGYWVCNSISGVSGDTYLRNLPYVSHSTANLYGAISIGYCSNFSITAGTSVSSYVNHNGSAAIGLLQYDATTGISSLQASEISSDGAIIFGGTYITN
jgi:hypothetical protein